MAPSSLRLHVAQWLVSGGPGAPRVGPLDPPEEGPVLEPTGLHPILPSCLLPVQSGPEGLCPLPTLAGDPAAHCAVSGESWRLVSPAQPNQSSPDI